MTILGSVLLLCVATGGTPSIKCATFGPYSTAQLCNADLHDASRESAIKVAECLALTRPLSEKHQTND